MSPICIVEYNMEISHRMKLKQEMHVVELIELSFASILVYFILPVHLNLSHFCIQSTIMNLWNEKYDNNDKFRRFHRRILVILFMAMLTKCRRLLVSAFSIINFQAIFSAAAIQRCSLLVLFLGDEWRDPMDLSVTQEWTVNIWMSVVSVTAHKGSQWRRKFRQNSVDTHRTPPRYNSICVGLFNRSMEDEIVCVDSRAQPKSNLHPIHSYTQCKNLI